MSGPVQFLPIGYKKPKVQTPQRHFADVSFSGGRNNMAIYALALGYNAINEPGGYINVIDRAALVYNGG